MASSIYVHESVPSSVSGLILPKASSYLDMLNSFAPVDTKGRGYCEIVSYAVGKALQHNGSEVGIVKGHYQNGSYTGHVWLRIQENTGFSVDMTHMQVGSPHMVIIVPSSQQKQFGLYSAKSDVEWTRNGYDYVPMNESVRLLMKELEDLFRN